MMKVYPINSCNECPYFESLFNEKKDKFIHICNLESDKRIIRRVYGVDDDVISIPKWCGLPNGPPPPRSPQSFLTSADVKIAEKFDKWLSACEVDPEMFETIREFLKRLIASSENE